MSQSLNINQSTQEEQLALVARQTQAASKTQVPSKATTAQYMAPQSPIVSQSAMTKGPSQAGAPATLSAMVEVKQALANTGLVDADTDLSPSCSTVVSTDSPSVPTQNPFYTAMPAMSPFLLQSLNNRLNTKMETATAINIQGSGDGMPEGTYQALSYAFQVSAAAINAVNNVVGMNSSKIAEMNTLMGIDAMQTYEIQFNQQQANMEKQEHTSKVGHIFGKIGKIGGEIMAGAMIAGGILTGDPAMVMIGVMMLAMCNSFISSHVIDGIAKVIMQIPGMENHPMIAHGIAEGLVFAAMILACVVTGNVGEAEGAVSELVEGAETVAKGAEEGAEAGSEADAFLDTGAELTDVATPNVGQAAVESTQKTIMEEGIQQGEKTMSKTFKETLSEAAKLMQDLGTSPTAQKVLTAAKGISAVMMAAGFSGQAYTETVMAKLTMNYAVIQSSLEFLQSIMDSVDMRNELNTSMAKDVTQAGIKELVGMFNSEYQAIDGVARNMYQA